MKLFLSLLMLISICSTVIAQDWQQVYPDFPTNDITSMVHWNGDTIFAVGVNGTFIKSCDAGKSWKDIFTNDIGYDFLRAETNGKEVFLLPGYSSRTFNFIKDPTYTYIFSYNPYRNDTTRIIIPIKYSGGSSSQYYFDISVNKECIVVYETTDKVALQFSTDDGKTWYAKDLPDTVAEASIYGPKGMVYFRNSRNGVLIAKKKNANDRTAFITTNGGDSWQEIPQANSYSWMDYYSGFTKLPAQWVSDSTFILVSYFNALLMTTDVGKTWIETSPLLTLITYFQFQQNGTGYLVGSTNDIYKSTNFGRYWIKIHNEMPSIKWYHPSAGVMLDENKFVTGSLNGNIIQTEDGGLTWNYTMKGMYSLQDVHFFSVTEGALEAFNIYDNSPGLYWTYDCGKTWMYRSSVTNLNASGNVADIRYASNKILYSFSVTNSDTLIYVSSDGGFTWIPSYIKLPGENMGVIAPPGTLNQGNDTMFVYSSKGILRTTNKGQSWDLFPDAFIKANGSSIRGMEMQSTKYKWALFNDKLLRSSDHGENWEIVFLLADTLDKNIGFKNLTMLNDSTISLQSKTQFNSQISSKPILFKSTNAGGSWSSRIMGYDPSEMSHKLFNSGVGYSFSFSMGYALTSEEGFLRTDDEWNTYKVIFSFRTGATYSKLNDIFFLDEYNGWLAGYNFIYRTTNGGINWIRSEPIISRSIELQQNYPNPFLIMTGTTISFNILGIMDTDVRVEVFDVLGKRKQILYEGHASPGVHSIHWSGDGISPGIYFVKLTSKKNQQVIKVVVLNDRKIR